MNRQFVHQVLRLTTRLRKMSTNPPSTGGTIPPPPSASVAEASASTAEPASAKDEGEGGEEDIQQMREKLGADNAKLFQRRRLHPNQANAVLDSQRAIDQFLDMGTSAGARRVGRAWRVSELRLKSFDDLHKLWFIMLKERNVLLTERAWCKTNGRHWTNGASNMYKIKTSMGRVKCVVGERIRAVKAKRVTEALRDEAEGNTDITASPKSLAVYVINEDGTTRREKWPEVSASGTPFSI